MRRVLSAVLAAIAAIGAPACRDKQVDQLEAVRATVCACKDVACGEAALAKVPHDDIESTHRTQAIAREMLDCLAKLYEAARPSTDPDDAPATGDGSDGSATGSSAGSATGSGAAGASAAPGAPTAGSAKASAPGTPAAASARTP